MHKNCTKIQLTADDELLFFALGWVSWSVASFSFSCSLVPVGGRQTRPIRLCSFSINSPGSLSATSWKEKARSAPSSKLAVAIFFAADESTKTMGAYHTFMLLSRFANKRIGGFFSTWLHYVELITTFDYGLCQLSQVYRGYIPACLRKMFTKVKSPSQRWGLSVCQTFILSRHVRHELS